MLPNREVQLYVQGTFIGSANIPLLPDPDEPLLLHVPTMSKPERFFMRRPGNPDIYDDVTERRMAVVPSWWADFDFESLKKAPSPSAS